MSDLNNQEKLEEIYRMTRENHDILLSIRRQQYFGNAMRILYWLIILGAIGGAYFFIKPLLDSFSANSGKVEQTVNQFNQFRSQFPESKFFEEVMKNLRPQMAASTTEQETEQ